MNTSYKHFIYDYLVSLGASQTVAKYLNMFALLIALLVAVSIIDYVIRKILRGTFSQFAAKSKTKFDDILVANKAPRNIAHIIPLLIVIEFIPVVFFDFPVFENFIRKSLEVFAIVLTLWIVRSLLNTTKDYLKTLPRLKDKPIASYIQVFMIFAWFAGFFLEGQMHPFMSAILFRVAGLDPLEGDAGRLGGCRLRGRCRRWWSAGPTRCCPGRGPRCLLGG